METVRRKRKRSATASGPDSQRTPLFMTTIEPMKHDIITDSPNGSTEEALQDDENAVEDVPRDASLNATLDVSDPVYSYVPLPKNHIRIFHLDPAPALNDPLVGRFEVIPLHEHDKDITGTPPYISLSYAWCSTELTETIICNGNPVKTTRSLYEALVRVREQMQLGALYSHGYYNPPLWIDGLCIDQSNAEERNHQVQSMACIYEQSSRLVIWLGEDEALFSDLYGEGCEDRGRALVRAPWFSRRWVIQEYRMLNEKKRSFLIHDQLLSAYHVTVRLTTMGLLSMAGPLRDRDSKRHSLVDELYAHQNAECHDPRDRVYALLGISSDSSWLRVDYKQPISDLYMAVARHYVRNAHADPQGMLSLLVSACIRKQKRGILYNALPSWVPDWRDVEEGMASVGSGAGAKPLDTNASMSRLLMGHESETYGKLEDQIWRPSRLQDARFRLAANDSAIGATGWLVGAANHLSVSHTIVVVWTRTTEGVKQQRLADVIGPPIQHNLELFIPGYTLSKAFGPFQDAQPLIYYPALLLQPVWSQELERNVFTLDSCLVLCESRRDMNDQQFPWGPVLEDLDAPNDPSDLPRLPFDHSIRTPPCTITIV